MKLPLREPDYQREAAEHWNGGKCKMLRGRLVWSEIELVNIRSENKQNGSGVQGVGTRDGNQIASTQAPQVSSFRGSSHRFNPSTQVLTRN